MYCTSDTAPVACPPPDRWVCNNRVIKARAGVVDAVARRGLGKPTFKMKSLLSWDWHVAGRCERPVYVTLKGRREEAFAPFKTTRVALEGRPGVVVGDTTRGGLPVHGDLTVRCRRCQRCRNFRRAMWTNRTLERLAETPGRIWFVTLTFDEPNYALITKQKAGPLSDAEFRAASSEGYKLVQKYLKLVRKGGTYVHEEDGIKVQPPATVRYVCTAEAGEKGGRLHYHFLLMEHGEPIKKRFLQQKWKFGHSHVKLVDERNDRRLANYVCKYLTKSLSARVYASQKLSKTERTPACDGPGGSPLPGAAPMSAAKSVELASTEVERQRKPVKLTTPGTTTSLDDEGKGNGSPLSIKSTCETNDGWNIPQIRFSKSADRGLPGHDFQVPGSPVGAVSGQQGRRERTPISGERGVGSRAPPTRPDAGICEEDGLSACPF